MAKWSTGGYPYGYKYDKEKNTLLINDYEYKVLKVIFNLANKGYGNTKIAVELNRAGFTSRRAKNWNSLLVGSKLSEEKLLFYKDYKNSYVQPLINNALYKSIISKKSEKRGNLHSFKTTNIFTRTNILKCGYCGSAIKTVNMLGKNKKLSYHYYICSSRNMKGKESCPNSKLFNFGMYNSLIISDVHKTIYAFNNSKTVKQILKNKYLDTLKKIGAHIGDTKLLEEKILLLKDIDVMLNIKVSSSGQNRDLVVSACSEIKLFNDYFEVIYKFPINDKLQYLRKVKVNS